MKPRYTPNYNRANYPHEFFAGYIEEFDLYLSKENDSENPVTLVGEEYVKYGHNYDCFALDNGQIISSDGYEQMDLHVTPYHMCLLYAACIEQGLIEEQGNEAET